jgi:UDP-2,3-diacylglucosamine hydrolase
MTSTPDGPIFFFADAHLTVRRIPEEIEREHRVADFLAHVREVGSRLYILGDLFDFWFEYRHAMPAGHLQVFRRLHELREAGVPMTFLAGNHDYWCLEFLAREFGMDVHPDALVREHQGRRIWMAHGDGLVRGDWGYRVLRKVLRNRFCIGAFRWVHPDLGIPLAHGSSSTSRHYTEARNLPIEAYVEEVVRRRWAEGFDAVLMGHIHLPTHREESGKEFFFLGDWITQFRYLTLENGAFTHHTWDRSPAR